MVVLFLVQPLVTKFFLATFDCLYFDVPRFSMDLSVDCGSEEHAYWQRMSAIGVLVYSLGIPFFAFVMLFVRRKHLRERRVKMALGFLFNGFEPRYYYFEAVYMVRKVIFAVVGAYPGFSSGDLRL